MELIEYRGFKNILIGLGLYENNYYLIYGKTGKVTINDINSAIASFLTQSSAKIFREVTLNIPFISNESSVIFTINLLKDIKEYYHLIEILENLL